MLARKRSAPLSGQQNGKAQMDHWCFMGRNSARGWGQRDGLGLSSQEDFRGLGAAESLASCSELELFACFLNLWLGRR